MFGVSTTPRGTRQRLNSEMPVPRFIPRLSYTSPKQAFYRTANVSLDCGYFNMARSETNLRSMIANGSDPKSLPWYESDLEEVPEPAKTLLAEYSKIPSDQVVHHVNSMVSS